jgi:hypothetical protein
VVNPAQSDRTPRCRRRRPPQRLKNLVCLCVIISLWHYHKYNLSDMTNKSDNATDEEKLQLKSTGRKMNKKKYATTELN